MKRTGQKLSKLAECMTAVPQVLLGVKVPHKPNLESIPQLQQAIEAGKIRLNDRGRVLVRYSGTEPLVRVMVEGQNDSVIREVAQELAGVVKACIK